MKSSNHLTALRLHAILPALCLAVALALWSASAKGEVQLEDGVLPYEEIDALYQRLSDAVNSLDSRSLSEVYAPNRYYLIPNSPMIRGLDGIRADWDAWFSWIKEGDGSLDVDFRIIAREIYNNKFGCDVGYASTLQKRPGEPDRVYNTKIFLVTKR